MSEANANEYIYLKLREDFFDRKEIKKLRKLAGGDTYTIVCLKILLLRKDSGGLIFYKGGSKNVIEQIALEIDESIENVSFCCDYLNRVANVTVYHDQECKDG